MNDLQRAGKYFIDALAIVNDRTEYISTKVSIFNNLDALYDRLGKYDDALDKFEKTKHVI